VRQHNELPDFTYDIYLLPPGPDFHPWQCLKHLGKFFFWLDKEAAEHFNASEKNVIKKTGFICQFFQLACRYYLPNVAEVNQKKSTAGVFPNSLFSRCRLRCNFNGLTDPFMLLTARTTRLQNLTTIQ
jgi:hypothetical protein